MELHSVHHRDIVGRLKELKTQGLYSGSLAGKKEDLAEKLIAIDGVLPERVGKNNGR